MPRRPRVFRPLPLAAALACAFAADAAVPVAPAAYASPRYALRLYDRWWDWVYLPVARVVQQAARVVGVLQQGRIALYLFYSFATLLALLAFTL